MSQSYSSNCFSTANVIETDMQNVENNFDALRSLFSGSSAPTSPDAGQLWYDTGSSSVKIRYNSSWVEWWDMGGQCVAAGQVKTASLAAGALSTDAAGRGKMANGYITNVHVADVDVTKVTNLNKAAVIFSWYTTGLVLSGPGESKTLYLSRAYLPNTGANKLKANFIGTPTPGNAIDFTITVNTSSVSFGSMTATYLDGATYVNVSTWLGASVNLSLSATANGAAGTIFGVCIYLTT